MLTSTGPHRKSAPISVYGSNDFAVTQATQALLAVEARQGPIADARARLALLDERLTNLDRATAEDVGEVADHLVASLTALRDSLEPAEDRSIRASQATDDAERLVCALDALIRLAARRALSDFRRVYAATVLHVVT